MENFHGPDTVIEWPIQKSASKCVIMKKLIVPESYRNFQSSDVTFRGRNEGCFFGVRSGRQSVRSGHPRKLPSTREVISLTKDRHKMCGPPKFF